MKAFPFFTGKKGGKSTLKNRKDKAAFSIFCMRRICHAGQIKRKYKGLTSLKTEMGILKRGMKAGSGKL